MSRPTPSEDVEPTYECVACGHRITDTDDRPADCPECGGDVLNISVPRDR